MPIVNIKISAAPDPALARAISQTVLELTSRILHKRPELTAITLDFVPPEQWFVAGKTLAELDQRSFYCEIKIVESTNTKDEKAEYVRETFAGFARLLGKLHPESYVYVQEVHGDAYGFGGLTQEYRYIQAKSPAASHPA